MGQSSALVIKVSPLPEQRSGDAFTFCVSSPTRDRYGDVVAPDWKLDAYKANNLVFYNHNTQGNATPIGKAHRLRLDKERRLIADLEFLPAGIDPHADLVRALVEAKFLHATSVGFLPSKADPLRDDAGHVTGFRYTGNELLEISVVGIPANPEALAFAKSLPCFNDESAARTFCAADPALFLNRQRRHLDLLRARVAR